MPTRDRRASLARALAGVNAQTFDDFELIVCDDGSRDGTAEWVRESRPDARVLVSPRPAGAAAGRNRGIDVARGELVALLDDDDVWRPAYLATQVAELDAHPDATLSYAGHVEVGQGGRNTTPDTRPLMPGASELVRLLADCPIHTSSVVVCRREAYDRYGPFDETLSIVHDYDWYALVLTRGGALHRLDEPLVERGLPGGLVTRHRAWYREESEVIGRWLAGRPADERTVRTYRALYFGRLALGKGDLTFGLARLAEALRRSPGLACRLAARAVGRRLDPVPAAVQP